MSRRVDVAVVGAGIVGLAHAWAAARRGLSVALFERHPRARGASVRNFGMVWPVGQPPGERLAIAMSSRERWLELGREAGLWVHPCGSLHLAYEPDEWAVLEEFAVRASGWGYQCELLSAPATLARCPAVRAEGLRGSLASATECCADPREVITRLPHFLAERHGVQLHFGRPVVGVDTGRLTTSDGEAHAAGRVLVCSGSDFETLFPEAFAGLGIRRCKLQMMRTAPQPGGWRLGPHVAGGLTLCHYEAFGECPSLPALRRRFEATMPDYVRHGIHVMASQNQLGEVVIGDSHEYDGDIDLFDKPEIDNLILRYLGRMLRLPDETVAARWHGVYAKHPAQAVVTARPLPGVELRVAPGGAGMTMSFGLAEAYFDGQPG
jgi:FAD dependent oxidoreductase TIGR03364